MARQTTVKTQTKSGRTKITMSKDNQLSARQKYKLKKMEMKLGKAQTRTERVKTRSEARAKTAKWDSLAKGITSMSGAAGSTGVTAAINSNSNSVNNSSNAAQAVSGGLVNSSNSRDEDEGVDG